MTKANQKLVKDFLRIAHRSVYEMLKFATIGLADVAYAIVKNPKSTAEKNKLATSYCSRLQSTKPIQ